MTVSEDTLLMILDRNPDLVYAELRGKDCSFDAIAVLLTYGIRLPAGREWGTRDQRKQWLESERAKRIRQNIAQLVPPQVRSMADLREFTMEVRARRGIGRLVQGILEKCKENLMEKV